MKFKHIFITASRGLRTHPSRSALTILGIVIGVAAIIVVMSLGQGAQSLILNQISGLGAEAVVVQPGSGGFNVDTLYSRALTTRDLEALERKTNVPNLVSAMPQLVVPEVVEYEGERYRPMIFGGDAAFYSEAYDIGLLEGVFFDQGDTRQTARVAVIGFDLAEELFGGSQAVGKNIRIQSRQFEVVGVYAEKGSVAGFDLDRIVIIPYTTAQVLTGDNYFTEIILKADLVENVDKMVFDVRATLRDTHDLKPGEDDDFNIQTQENLISQIQSVIAILTAFLGAVVAISLVVGGIGIMNIMLVSVTERTKEIGLRKSLGARRKDILRQFLVEAVVLTSIGGLIGVILGALIAYGASLILAAAVDPNWSFVFPINAAILGVGVSAGVGLVFGIYPANEAGKKSPIEALRYE
jgi:putative ABC transport system permease protein